MMYCKKCGTKQEEGQKFCSKCGTPYPEVVVNEPIVSKPLNVSPNQSQTFQTNTKQPDITETENFAKSEERQQGAPHENDDKKQNKRENESIVGRLNEFIGNDSPADLNWKILFSDVNKRHTKEEAEEIFIYGTRKTTPTISDVSKDWPHPWLYTRIFLLFLVAFALLMICIVVFENFKALPGFILIGAFAVPLSVLVLFYELNVWRNVSVYEVAKTFMVGGCASIVVTLFLFQFVEIDELNYKSAFTVGFIEELGKALIVYYFIKQSEKVSVLNGMLIGAAVGSGFAAFETAGYILENPYYILDIIFLRGILAPGGHVAWAALSGAGLAIAAKSKKEVSLGLFAHGSFLRLFFISIVLHGLWDSPIKITDSQFPVFQTCLVIAVWIVVLLLVNMGLGEISKTKKQ